MSATKALSSTSYFQNLFEIKLLYSLKSPLKCLNKSKKIIENDFNPLSDMRASSQYRNIVSQNLLERFYLEVKNNRSETIN